MLTVDDYGRIRRAHRDGMGIREIARPYGQKTETGIKFFGKQELSV